MSETKFCTKIDCSLKPINKITTIIVNAFCEFNGSRDDIEIKKNWDCLTGHTNTINRIIKNSKSL